MSARLPDIERFFAASGASVLVRVAEARGSAPRETDAFMLVSAGQTCGTIGGGQLEYLAIDQVRRMLRDGIMDADADIPLGPEIGQCCGGRVKLNFARLDSAGQRDLLKDVRAAEQSLPEILIFGGGHVGRALAVALAPLPYRVTLTDTRPEELRNLPVGITSELAIMPEALVRAAAPGTAYVVLTHDHALDFLIMREVLLRGDAAYAGMIGSKTKKAQFRRWFLSEDGTLDRLDGLTCPIGGPVRDKRPEIIAALVVAEIIGAFGQGHCPKSPKDAKLIAQTQGAGE